MTEMTREGNEVFPPDAPIRLSMPDDTLCRTCLHAADLCRTITKHGHINIDGFQVWYECSGYEDTFDLIEDNK